MIIRRKGDVIISSKIFISFPWIHEIVIRGIVKKNLSGRGALDEDKSGGVSSKKLDINTQWRCSTDDIFSITFSDCHASELRSQEESMIKIRKSTMKTVVERGRASIKKTIRTRVRSANDKGKREDNEAVSIVYVVGEHSWKRMMRLIGFAIVVICIGIVNHFIDQARI